MIEYLKDHSDVVAACGAALITGIFGLVTYLKKRNKDNTKSQSINDVKNSSINQVNGNVNIGGNLNSENKNSGNK